MAGVGGCKKYDWGGGVMKNIKYVRGVCEKNEMYVWALAKENLWGASVIFFSLSPP